MRFFSNETDTGKPCVFPFKYKDVTAYGCIVYYEGEQVKTHFPKTVNFK